MMAFETERVGRQGVFVLGMHRSGTSALTGVMQRLGVELGENLLPANKDNARGFWENRLAMEINEELLASLSRSWDAAIDLPASWLDSPAAGLAYAKAISLLDAEFSGAQIWALKDPRICRLAPLWLKAARTVGVQPLVVIIVRRPSEVVASLGERDGLPAGLSSLLWLQHLLDAERHSRGVPRVMVTYEQLLSDWRSVSDRMAEAFGVAWPERGEHAEEQVDNFLSRAERHHHHIGDPLGLPLAEEAYELCCKLADGGDEADWSGLEKVSATLGAAWSVLGQPLSDMYVAAEKEARSRLDERGEWEERKRKDLQFFQSHIEKLNGENRELGDRLLSVAATGVDRDNQVAQLGASLGAMSETLSRLLERDSDPQRFALVSGLTERMALLQAEGEQVRAGLNAQEIKVEAAADGLKNFIEHANAGLDARRDELIGLNEALRAFIEHSNAGMDRHESGLTSLTDSVAGIVARLDLLANRTEELAETVASHERRLLGRGWTIRGLLGVGKGNLKSGDMK